MCDVVYALLLERLFMQVAAERQVAAVLIAAGNDVEVPTYQDAQDNLDAALLERPVDTERAELLRALGVS